MHPESVTRRATGTPPPWLAPSPRAFDEGDEFGVRAHREVFPVLTLERHEGRDRFPAQGDHHRLLAGLARVRRKGGGGVGHLDLRHSSISSFPMRTWLRRLIPMARMVTTGS